MGYSRAMVRRGDPKVKRLGQVQLFSGCSKRDLERIAALSNEVEVSAGTVLMRQGDPGHEAFVIEKGKAKATVRGKRSRSMGPGECFGEMALLHAAPRSATVSAETDMTLVVLGSREFWTLLEDVPRVALKVLAAVGERLRDNEGKLPTH
jgi:CRP/FNR family transcriptional regulator, cyclic AMP receptor protein